VGAFSRSEASAKLNANLKAYLPEGVATVAAVETVKERILPLTTLPKHLGAFTGEMSGSTSEADYLARAEAWADRFQATARMDVEGAADMNVFNTLLRDETGKSPLFTTRDLMRELLDTGAPVKLPTARFNVPPAMFASTIRESKRAKAAFNVDLVSEMVDFASGAHRMAAAELLPSPPPASQAKSSCLIIFESGMTGVCDTLGQRAHQKANEQKRRGQQNGRNISPIGAAYSAPKTENPLHSASIWRATPSAWHKPSG
jgi:hypothetical protein